MSNNFITVPIQCYVAKSESNAHNELLESIGLEPKEEEAEYETRPGRINIHQVLFYHASFEKDRTVVEFQNTIITVPLPYAEFDKLINNANA